MYVSRTMRRTGGVDAPRPVTPEVSPMRPHRTCSTDGCDTVSYARGWCRQHYDYRRRRRVDPLVGTRRARNHISLAARLWAGALADGTGCWVWQRARDRSGYGHIGASRSRNNLRAHRVAYELVKGLIPDGLVLDHLCRNPSCINPDHLEAVTDRVNILRGIGMGARYARRTHCDHGHAFDEANTYVSRGYRGCRTCRAASDARRYARGGAR